MTINERIKIIRKDLGLTQSDFGETIGLKKSAANQLEQEGYNVSAQSIQLICNNFDINEEWLRFGTGEMYKSRGDSLMAELAEKHGLTVRMTELVRSMCGLDAVIQEQVCDFIRETAKAMEEAKQRAELQEIRESLPNGNTMTADEVAFMQRSLEAYRFEKNYRETGQPSSGLLKNGTKK